VDSAEDFSERKIFVGKKLVLKIGELSFQDFMKYARVFFVETFVGIFEDEFRRLICFEEQLM
jgi:hypothetical protein